MASAISRRSMLGGVLGIGAGAALAGCGSQAPLNIPLAARTGTPASGGVLRIARPAASAAETLDPASSLSAYEYLGALYNRLVKLDEDGLVVPDLAEEWSSDAEARTWTFRLRSGVSFHDGRPLHADDAVHSITRILDPALGSPQAETLASMFAPEDVTALDATTVRFALQTPNAEFPSLLTAYQCYIIPADPALDPDTAGIGTGPFRLESYVPAGPGAIVASPDHFAGAPVLDRIEFSSIQDTTARVNALLAGQVDLLAQTNLDNPTARVVTGSRGTTVARVADAQWYTIPVLATAPEFADPRIRQALKLAYDPEAILATAIQGEGTAGWDNPIPPGMVGRLEANRTHDPERAARLLQEAGAEDLRAIITTSSYEPNLTPIATAFADQVAQAGISLRISSVSADSYYTNAWMQVPMMVSYFSTGRPIDQILNQMFRTGSSYNESLWSDERFDQLLDAARAELDADARMRIYQDAQQLLIDESPHMTPIYGDRLVGLSERVVNYREFGFEFDYLGIGLEG